MTSIALATCAVLPDLAADDRPLLAGLRAAGADARAVVWDDPEVDWSAFDLVVLRSTWDYAKRRDEFLAWAERAAHVTRFANPYPVVRWNSDKHYLLQLAEAGVAVVPTQWLEPERRLSSHAVHTRFPAMGEFVIPDLLGGPDALTIGRVLWTEFFTNRDWPLASAVAVAMLLLIVIPTLVFEYVENRREEREAAT